MTDILAVSHTPIWPARSGSSVRRQMALEALAELGDVDLLFVGEVSGLPDRTPSEAPVRRVDAWPAEKRRPDVFRRALWALRPTRPLQLLEWTQHPPVRPLPMYELVWYFRPLALELSGGVPARAAVVDLDDLEDRKLRLSHEVADRRPPLPRRLAERRNAVAWKRYQRAVSEAVEGVIVCTHADCAALGSVRCFVVPNGFPEVESDRDPDVSTLLLVGAFDYEPNADAAEFMAMAVMPLVRRARPEAELRLVGRSTPRVARLAGPGVKVVGEVPDLAAEYSRATVAVAPVRFGGGTRVKIIEAFARKTPVVSTTMGAEGLRASEGVHLLIGDDAAGFARACVELMADPDRAVRLTADAHELYRRDHSQLAVSQAVQRVVEAVSGGAAR